MGDLSKNFSRREFACKCGCGFGLDDGDVSPVLIEQLQSLRNKLQVPIMITSGCRCERHNRRVGGARKSKHLFGFAADIRVQGHSPRIVAQLLDEIYPHSHGIGRYRSWVHFDVRQNRARWSG